MSRARNKSKTLRRVSKRSDEAALPPSVPFLAGRKLYGVLCVLLAAATTALYSPVAGHAFVALDDQDYVTSNAHIHGGLSWSTIKWAFTSTEAANWHPLTWLSHALDYQLFALNPAGHHMDSVLIHALNAVLLFLLLAWATKRVGPSLLVALLFALHPINVESVAWVAERKNVLSTFFFLLAIGAYGRYAQKPEWRRYLLVMVLFVAGLMAKPMVITLPFVLLLLDYWPLGRTAGSPASGINAPQLTTSRLALEKIPLLVFSAASAWITIKAQRGGHAVRTFSQFPLTMRIENAIVAYGLYLWKMLWPARLAVLYPHAAGTLPVWQVTFSALTLVGVTAVVLVFRRKRYLPVGWFWFLGTLIPVIGLVQVGEAAMADRYAYIPLIGIFVMIAWSLGDWAEAQEVRTVWRIIPALCALTALATVTYRQIGYWESEYGLWSHTLAVTEQNAHADAVLGTALLNPDSAMTRLDLENFATEQERTDEARRHYEDAIKIYRQLVQQSSDAYLPDMAATLSNLGDVARLQNQTNEARQHYEEALRYYRQLIQQNPGPHLLNTATTLSNLAALDRRQNQLDDAHQLYDEALRYYRQLAQQDPDKYLPDVVDTLVNLGFLEKSQMQPDEAYLHFEEALKIGRQLAQQDPDKYLPNLANRLVNLGNFDTEQNRIDEGSQHYEEALNIYRQLAQQKPTAYLPDVAIVLNNLGRVDQLQNRFDASRASYKEALSILKRLSQGDSRYLGDVAKVEASLEELDKSAPLR